MCLFVHLVICVCICTFVHFYIVEIATDGLTSTRTVFAPLAIRWLQCLLELPRVFMLPSCQPPFLRNVFVSCCERFLQLLGISKAIIYPTPISPLPFYYLCKNQVACRNLRVADWPCIKAVCWDGTWTRLSLQELPNTKSNQKTLNHLSTQATKLVIRCKIIDAFSKFSHSVCN